MVKSTVCQTGAAELENKMNERIKELEDMANRFANGIVFPDNFNDAAVSWHRRIEFNAKFAELIVRECAIIDFCKSPAGLTGEQDNNVSKMIKQHFGVN
jgi:hypothetical protein